METVSLMVLMQICTFPIKMLVSISKILMYFSQNYKKQRKIQTFGLKNMIYLQRR